MRRARMSIYPRLPKDLSELDSILRSDKFKHLTLTKEGDGYLYAGCCGSARTHSRCLIFQSPKMKEIMATATEIFADATWDGRPACPASSQVFSITTVMNHQVSTTKRVSMLLWFCFRENPKLSDAKHSPFLLALLQFYRHFLCGTFAGWESVEFHCNIFFQILPLCVCLMERKNRRTYTVLLKSIKMLNPRFSPSKIHTDFEIAEFSAFKNVFQEAEVEGCLFHYSNVSLTCLCILQWLIV